MHKIQMGLTIEAIIAAVSAVLIVNNYLINVGKGQDRLFHRLVFQGGREQEYRFVVDGFLRRRWLRYHRGMRTDHLNGCPPSVLRFCMAERGNKEESPLVFLWLKIWYYKTREINSRDAVRDNCEISVYLAELRPA